MATLGAVDTEHASIRPVRYAPPSGVGELELTSLAQLRERAGVHEFVAPQR
jgi:hypothetical protein